MNYFKIFIILYVSTIIWNLENLELSNEINQDWIHSLHKKWNFPLKISSIMWSNPQFSADLVTFTEEIHNGKFHFLYSDS